MHKSPLLDANHQFAYLFGGDDAWKQFEHRGFTVSLEWVFADSGRRVPPVMAIWPSTGLALSPGAGGAWVIVRTDMANFFEARENGTDSAGNARVAITGTPSKYAIREARQALPLLGKDPNDKAALSALLDCVMTFGPMVAQIPVAPKARLKERATAPMWEVTALDKSSGKIKLEAEV